MKNLKIDFEKWNILLGLVQALSYSNLQYELPILIIGGEPLITIFLKNLKILGQKWVEWAHYAFVNHERSEGQGPEEGPTQGQAALVPRTGL